MCVCQRGASELQLVAVVVAVCGRGDVMASAAYLAAIQASGRCRECGCGTRTFCCVSASAQLGDAMCHMPVSTARQAAAAAAGERDAGTAVPLSGDGPAVPLRLYCMGRRPNRIPASGRGCSGRDAAATAGCMTRAAVWTQLLLLLLVSQAVAAVERQLSDLGPCRSCCEIAPASRARGGEQASPSEEAMAAAERRMSSWDIIECCRAQTRPLFLGCSQGALARREGERACVTCVGSAAICVAMREA